MINFEIRLKTVNTNVINTLYYTRPYSIYEELQRHMPKMCNIFVMSLLANGVRTSYLQIKSWQNKFKRLYF